MTTPRKPTEDRPNIPGCVKPHLTGNLRRHRPQIVNNESNKHMQMNSSKTNKTPCSSLVQVNLRGFLGFFLCERFMCFAFVCMFFKF